MKNSDGSSLNRKRFVTCVAMWWEVPAPSIACHVLCVIQVSSLHHFLERHVPHMSRIARTSSSSVACTQTIGHALRERGCTERMLDTCNIAVLRLTTGGPSG